MKRRNFLKALAVGMGAVATTKLKGETVEEIIEQNPTIKEHVKNKGITSRDTLFLNQGDIPPSWTDCSTYAPWEDLDIKPGDTFIPNKIGFIKKEGDI